MHCRRVKDQLSENYFWPGTEVQPEKTKDLSYISSVGISSLCVPKHRHPIPNLHPKFFGIEISALSLQGSPVQWDQKLVPSCLLSSGE